MLLFLAFLAAIGCAVFNGSAAVLEKVGADQKEKAHSAHPNLLWKLKTNFPYLAGIALDLTAWLLTLFAVHVLPLFLVQPIIACSLIVTILIEYLIFKRRFTARFALAIPMILIGLILLALVSTPEKSTALSHAVRIGIIAAPLVLVVLGAVLTSIHNRYTTFVLASISGLAFGGLSIAGRAIRVTHPYTHVIFSSLAASIVAYGLVGILFFTIALQRASATTVNATMIACETILPIVIGIALLGDHPKHGLWLVVVLGCVFTFAGIVTIAFSAEET